jgi:lipid-A-disaccharide synthase
MIVAGEASGEKHGAALCRALKQIRPDLKFEIFGSGGEEMRRQGVEILVDARDVSIIGALEILRALGRLRRAYKTMLEEARKRRPDAIVLIDWPDFNLRLAKRLRRDGFKIIYYISPQVWAWKQYRVRTIRRFVDKMLVILPFEEEFYRARGIQAEYVGHPLVGAVRVTTSREEFSLKHGLDPKKPLIALLPGSREREVHYHLPEMLDAAGRISKRMEAQFAIPLASTVNRSQVEQILNRSGVAAKLIERDTYNTVGHAVFAIVASGTATLESALLGTPMVIIYRASRLNYMLIRPLIKLDTFGMVNLVAGRRIVPELIQSQANGARIAEETLKILSDPERLYKMRRDLMEVQNRVGTSGDASLRAARAVIESLMPAPPTPGLA